MKNASTSLRGFTLPELLIAMAVAGLVVAGVLSLFMQALNTYHYDVGKILVNRDIRRLTSEMTSNATSANYFRIYPSFTSRTRQEIITGNTSPTTVENNLNDGSAGDFLLLVYNDADNNAKINRLVGYYRSPSDPTDPDSEGPVRQFDLTFSPSVEATPLSLIPDTSTANDWPAVIEISTGLANGSLFYNYRDRSIMVKGNIIHRGSLHKRAFNTYNFTISPRG